MRVAVMMLTLWGAGASAQFAGPVAAPAPRAPSSYRLETVTTGSRDAGELRERIRDGRRSGQLDRTDARRFRRETAQLDNLAARYGGNGLSDAEARELQVRGLVLRDQIDSRRTQGFGNPARRR